MSENNSRNFNCKDEELPVMGGFLCSSLKNHSTLFSGYSPKFSLEYLTGFETQVTIVSDLVNPKDETALRKVITKRIYDTMDDLGDVNYRLEGYIDLAKDNISISPADFGIKVLRKGIKSRDAEKVLNGLKSVINFITTFKEALIEVGATEALLEKYNTAQTKINADKLEQYNLAMNRAGTVQTNVGELNKLYEIMKEVMKFGKIIFKNDAAKTKEYTYANLLSKVRHVLKKEDEATGDAEAEEEAAE